MKTKKYLVKLMFNINIDNGTHSNQFDEQVRVIEAKNNESAFQKARHLGKKEEESFLNHDGKTVNWQFIDVTELYELENVKDGEQIYSTTHEDTERNSFIDFIKQKALIIQANFLTFA